jgi:hypothetical protein
MGDADMKRIEAKAKRLRQIGVEGTKHVILKNNKYGDAIRKVAAKMRADYPDGVSPDQYEDMLLWVRCQDKLTRVGSYTPERREADDESPWSDIRGYGMLGEEKDLDPASEGLPPGKYDV